MSEFTLINNYFKSTGKQRDDVRLGIGDDCALLKVPAGKLLATSTDTLILGVHFPIATNAEDIGFKSLAVNLSDLAAMGATPAWVSLAISLPEQDDEWLKNFVKGFTEQIQQYDLQLIGGDTTKGHLSITVQVFGFVDEGRKLLRQNAKPDQLIFVTGDIGNASLGLEVALGNISNTSLDKCVSELNRPTPRIEIGKALTSISNCAIDISDGLLADLGHIIEESLCGARIDLNKIPLSKELKAYYGQELNWKQVLTGGDDYELCFTIERDQQDKIKQLEKEYDVKMTCIGEITNSNKIECYQTDGTILKIDSAGFDHFNK